LSLVAVVVLEVMVLVVAVADKFKKHFLLFRLVPLTR
jgi:hypothetical protein